MRRAIPSIALFAIILGALALGTRAASAQAQTHCRTVIGEVEGFFRDHVKFTAERSRDEAVKAEVARREEMGREVVEVALEDTSCKAVYPLGLEEWHCVASARVCVAR
jgi:predicted ATP-grasp superfamily ATP-dependent carboligase